MALTPLEYRMCSLTIPNSKINGSSRDVTICWQPTRPWGVLKDWLGVRSLRWLLKAEASLCLQITRERVPGADVFEFCDGCFPGHRGPAFRLLLAGSV